MRFIYIGFSAPIKFKIGAALIKWWTSAPYSHVYLRFDSSNQKVPSNIYHAANGMVHFKTFNNFKKENQILKEYSLILSEDKRLDILIDAMNKSSIKYGYLELIKIFVSDIFFFLSKKEIKFKNSKGYICSELVADMLESYFKIKFDKPKHLLKPEDIDRAMRLFIESQSTVDRPTIELCG